MAKWSELTYDVLVHLTRFLSIQDYHRFSAVCQNWSRVAKEKHHFPAQQVPWLALGEEKDTNNRKFFNLFDGIHYNLNVPGLHGRYICGSKFGWLFTIDLKLNFQLLNPLTKQCYNLPSPPPYYSDNFEENFPARLEEIDKWNEETQLALVIKATFDYDPRERSDFTVLILYGEVCTPSFWRPGNDGWTNINGLTNHLHDIAFYKGKFYTVSNPIVEKCSVIYEIDVGVDPKAIKVGPQIPLHGDPNFEYVGVMDEVEYDASSYIVELDGELVLVESYFERFDDHRTTTEFFVHKVDLEAESYKTCQHIDGHTLFLGGTSSAVAFRPCQWSNCMKDAIYFTDFWGTELYGCDDLGIYDLLEKTSHNITRVMPFTLGKHRPHGSPLNHGDMKAKISFRQPIVNSSCFYSGAGRMNEIKRCTRELEIRHDNCHG